MADEAGGASKSAAKSAKTDAGKAAKKKPDPEGLALIAKADAAMAAKDFAEAIRLYQEGEAKCRASSASAAPKEKKPKPPQPDADGGGKPAAAGAAADAAAAEEEAKPRLYLELPASNTQAKPLREGGDAACNYAANAPVTLAAHLAATGGAYRTRFPPEPNGYLHMGHAKAMNFNFGQARIAREDAGVGVGGETVMRFDDTNPTAEKQEFIDSILGNVKWLGHSPVKVTYSSDYFGRLYELALQLIRSGNAYVCHQTADEMKASRGLLRAYYGAPKPNGADRGPLPKGAASPWRERPAAESEALFVKMKQGRLAEGEAVLRMKGDLKSDNSSMWDPAAYRIMFHAHPRTGDEWCIYPTYDYTHCIVDSLEDITHSLCTLEFNQRQAADGPYYWLLHALQLYKPATWEYSRLNLTHCVMSKRNLKLLVEQRHVSGWDDPRMVTLDGMRRRGLTASIVNRFCEAIGVTKSKMVARVELLEHIARQEFDATAHRRFAVLRPIRVVLADGFPAGGKEFEMSNHPKDEAAGKRKLRLGETIYIDADDFREVDDPKYYGLAPNKEVGLLGAGVNITCVQVVRTPSGAIDHLVASVDATRERKPKGHLHWVDAATAKPAEFRVYDVLFTPEDPEAAAKALKDEAAGGGGGEEEEEEEEEEDEGADGGAPGWLKLLNPSSLVVEKGYVEASLLSSSSVDASAPNAPCFQFTRLGYFAPDVSSSRKAPVFNRVVALKEDKEKRK